MKSIFTEKQVFPQDNDLRKALGKSFNLWQTLEDYVYSKYPTAMKEWCFSKSGGWSFRMKDNKRVIIYFLPRDQFFKVALVFGQKATEQVMSSSISTEIKMALNSAKVYAEGRGIRIDVEDEAIINDIKELINIKLAK
jgi:hypothetical protein